MSMRTRTERSRSFAWRPSVNRSIPWNGRFARRQFSSRSRNRRGDRPFV